MYIYIYYSATEEILGLFLIGNTLNAITCLVLKTMSGSLRLSHLFGSKMHQPQTQLLLFRDGSQRQEYRRLGDCGGLLSQKIGYYFPSTAKATFIFCYRWRVAFGPEAVVTILSRRTRRTRASVTAV